MLGYWRDEAATRAAIDANGWMHTGDLGTIDAGGWAHISGRSKDTVIRGGENLLPAEIEGYMHQHPEVAEVQVFGVPDAFFGEELCAWVRAREGGAGVSAEALREWCTERISKHKVPRYIMIKEEPFPCTASGKPQKFAMRRRAIEELSLPIIQRS
jgi:fatty-acyl-CoA synthase